jgi:putative membrane protein
MTARDDEKARLDIDVRFLLANERTLLAWLRTALTLMAGGVALAQFAGDRQVWQGIGVALLVLGGLGGLIGLRGSARLGAQCAPGNCPRPVTARRS